MTPKQVIRIDLAEIVTLEIACTHCKSVSSLPLPAPYLTNELRCLGCNALLWGAGVQEAGNMVKQLVDVLTTWKHYHSKAPFTLGFSLDAEPSRASGSKV
jgi:phage FluMu protein Com